MPLDLTNQPPYYTIDGPGLNFKEYFAFIDQVGTMDPAQTKRIDQIGIEDSYFTRLSAGIYNLYCPGVPFNSLFIIGNSEITTTEINQNYIIYNGIENLMIRTYENGTLSDGVLSTTPLYIKKYTNF